MAELTADSVQQKVLQRAKELSRLHAGKASETISFRDTMVQIDADSVARNSLDCESGDSDVRGNPITSQRDASTDIEISRETSERGQIAVGGSVKDSDALWERISKMEEAMHKSGQQQIDILSSVVLNVAKIQKRLDSHTDNVSVHPTDNNSRDDTSERSLDHDETEDQFDRLFSGNSKSSDADGISDNFLADLEESYQAEEIYGPEINPKLADLVNNAVDKKLSDDVIKGLATKYLVPKNCPKMTVPKVNRELWQAFKPTRSADLAMQSSQRSMQMAMVPILQSLETLMTNGDVTKIRDMLKDTFRILAHGMNENNRKRRSLIKPLIPAKYKKVCTNDTPTSDYLFGEGLDQQVEDIEKEDRRAQKLSGRSTNKPTGNFLVQRGPQGPQWISKGDGRQMSRGQHSKPHPRQGTGYPQHHGKPGQPHQGKSQSQKRPLPKY